jgi:uncharacterized protein (DUF362 family)
MIEPRTTICDPRVAICLAPGGYDEPGCIEDAVSRAAKLLDWAIDGNEPLGETVCSGDRVLIKPNLVTHRNQGPWGLGPLITNASQIFAVANAVLRSEPSEVLVGDAPVQGCDFKALIDESGIRKASEELVASDQRFKGIVDFRRTTCDFVAGVRRQEEDLRSLDQFVLFDLGSESLLEDVTDDRSRFRVTCYDPNLLAKTHSKGKHQYLVAREVIESHLVVNLPKLKTHKKAGVTCALKNLIGINGNKEYLPHHRIGGAGAGGDCYPETSMLKSSLEHALDKMNSASSFAGALIWRQAASHLTRAVSLTNDQLGVEGSWSGNDTIWRTCLDLNRILIYGRADGTLAERPQRKVIHIVDAVIAGHGDGPLRPEPLPLGLVLAGSNAAAIDWVGAQLLGYEPGSIPCIKNAFGGFRWPLTEFQPDDILLSGDLGDSRESIRRYRQGFRITHPAGWLDARL